jgi:uncharacterized SAM-binding protein YcdF (DUF218 family)
VVIAGAFLAAAAVFAVLSVRLFVVPPVPGPERVDAIVVLGGAGPRIRTALTLAEQGYADEIVFSTPAGEYFGRPLGVCLNGVLGVRVTCVDPVPVTTQGEARIIGQLADERGWTSVMVVASDSQALRALVLTRRCFDGEVRMAHVTSDHPWWYEIPYEWGATIKAFTLKRGC